MLWPLIVSKVEAALDEQNIPGRDYLEKILQPGFDLPAAPVYLLKEQVAEAIENALSGVDNLREARRLPNQLLEYTCIA